MDQPWLFLLLMVSLPGLAQAQPAVTHRPAEYGVAIEKNLMIPVRDGVRLAVDIYLPTREGKPAPGAFPCS